MPKIPGKILALGGAVYVLTTGGVYFYMQNRKTSLGEWEGDGTKKGSEIFDIIASKYDDAISSDERLLSLDSSRKELLEGVDGLILEVAAGYVDLCPSSSISSPPDFTSTTAPAATSPSMTQMQQCLSQIRAKRCCK